MSKNDRSGLINGLLGSIPAFMVAGPAGFFGSIGLGLWSDKRKQKNILEQKRKLHNLETFGDEKGLDIEDPVEKFKRRMEYQKRRNFNRYHANERMLSNLPSYHKWHSNFSVTPKDIEDFFFEVSDCTVPDIRAKEYEDGSGSYVAIDDKKYDVYIFNFPEQLKELYEKEVIKNGKACTVYTSKQKRIEDYRCAIVMLISGCVPCYTVFVNSYEDVEHVNELKKQREEEKRIKEQTIKFIE